VKIIAFTAPLAAIVLLISSEFDYPYYGIFHLVALAVALHIAVEAVALRRSRIQAKMRALLAKRGTL
jgi:hypothetical protein